MATIVNNPPAAQESDNGSGFLLGTVLVIVCVAGMLYVGIPMIRNNAPDNRPTEINNIVPPQQPAPQALPDGQDIKIPENIDVNINEKPAQ